MISDRHISTTTALALLLWAAGGAMVVLAIFIHLWFAGIGLWISGIGGCMWIRAMFCQQAQREVKAFELGRQIEREAGLRSV